MNYKNKEFLRHLIITYETIKMDFHYYFRSIPYKTEFIADGVKRILLPVLNGGKHRVHVYFNGREIRGKVSSIQGREKNIPTFE